IVQGVGVLIVVDISLEKRRSDVGEILSGDKSAGGDGERWERARGGSDRAVVWGNDLAQMNRPRGNRQEVIARGIGGCRGLAQVRRAAGITIVKNDHAGHADLTGVL